MISANERRSARSKKTIDYAGCDNLSDDDFADTTPPPPKKSKITSEDRHKSGKLTVKTKDPTLNLESTLRSKKQRKPPNDRAFDQDLQEALQLSLLETGSSQSDQDDHRAESVPPPPPLSPILADRKLDDPELDPHSNPPPLLAPEPVVDAAARETKVTKKAPVNAVPYSIVMDESIEVLEDGKSQESDSGRRKTSRRQTKKKAIVIESDEEDEEESDFNPDNDDDDESEEEEGLPADAASDADDGDSDDSDFTVKTKVKKKAPSKPNKPAPRSKLKNITNTQKKSPAKNCSDKAPLKSSTPAKTAITPDVTKPAAIIRSSRTQKAATPAAAAAPPPLKSRPEPVRSTLSSPPATSGPCRASPSVLSSQWKPPARVGSDGAGSASVSTVKSPTSGLRLGLSRNQRVKPLHSSAKVT